MSDNKKLVEILLKHNASAYNEDIKYRDVSPLFVAIDNQKLWAVEVLCDYGAKIETMVNSKGRTGLIHAGLKGFDDIAMYLSLRANDVD